MSVRWYSEADHTFGPPPDQSYAAWPECKANGAECESGCRCETVPVQLPRDPRPWCSVEWAREHGMHVPENWRELL